METVVDQKTLEEDEQTSEDTHPDISAYFDTVPDEAKFAFVDLMNSLMSEMSTTSMSFDMLVNKYVTDAIAAGAPKENLREVLTRVVECSLE